MLNDAALVTGATAIKNEITHLQLHSDTPGAGWTANVIGTRVAAAGAVDADGDITWTDVEFTGLPSNSPVTHVSYWTAGTGGANRGGAARASGGTNDETANAAGVYTLTSVTETSTAT